MVKTDEKQSLYRKKNCTCANCLILYYNIVFTNSFRLDRPDSVPTTKVYNFFPCRLMCRRKKILSLKGDILF